MGRPTYPLSNIFFNHKKPMNLDIPYIFDPTYLSLLRQHKERIHSLDFALPGNVGFPPFLNR